MTESGLDWFLARVSKTNYDQVNALVEQAKEKEKLHCVAFHNWMLENDTSDNAERFANYTDVDMYNEFINISSYENTTH